LVGQALGFAGSYGPVQVGFGGNEHFFGVIASVFQHLLQPKARSCLAILSNDSLEDTSKASITPSALRKKDFVRVAKRSTPAVSHTCKMTLVPFSTTSLALVSTLSCLLPQSRDVLRGKAQTFIHELGD